MNGLFFHIYNRGNNGEDLFIEERNYNYFLRKFFKYLHDFLDIYVYCLMPEHFHFIVKIKNLDDGNCDFFKIPIDFCKQLSPIEKAFKDFFISYSKSINKAYGRTGSLFQYKYKRNLIGSLEEMCRLIAYIHTNPVRRGLCNNFDDWYYSSYNSIVQLSRVSDVCSDIVNMFGGLNSFKNFHENYNDSQRESNRLFKNYYKDKIPRLSEYIMNYLLYNQLFKPL